ncbi:MAG: tRNA (adenosine(37)-N6)-threonylcarbamoyltransferase complex ATPase subunit type 1 TsaE [Patescibacteria group bacterium]
MSNKIFNTFTAKETQQLAGDILAGLLKNPSKGGALVLALSGDLGSGKTTFTQGIAKALGVRGRVASPTFIIMRNYKLLTINYKRLYHFDCYRLNKPEEILSLGWQEIISNPKNIVVIEWPEKIKKFLPKQIIYLKFKFLNENQREIKI